MTEEEIRLDEKRKIQSYIDKNNVYQVDFGHYEEPLKMKWIPLQTKKVNILGAINADNDIQQSL